jgi:hypothetical protein
VAKDEALGTAIIKYCFETAHELNRNYVVTVLIKKALDRHYGTFQKRKRAKVKVLFPSYKGGITERKITKAYVEKQLQQSLDFDTYKHSLITAVSVMEDLLSKIVRSVLQRFPERLNATAAGEKIDKTIKLSLVLESSDLAELRNRLVDRRVLQVFYESPRDYFEHFTVITGLHVPKGDQNQYIEIKATRDVLIHNRGVISETYLGKTESSARGKLGETIPLTEKYFADSIVNLKKFLVSLIAETRKIFGGSSASK